MTSPECTAGPPASKTSACVRSSAISSPAALAEAVERDLVRHRRGRQEERLLLPEQLGRTTLQLVDGRVLAQLLVADLGGGHRGTHLRRRDRRRVRAKVDHA